MEKHSRQAGDKASIRPRGRNVPGGFEEQQGGQVHTVEKCWGTGNRKDEERAVEALEATVRTSVFSRSKMGNH